MTDETTLEKNILKRMKKKQSPDTRTEDEKGIDAIAGRSKLRQKKDIERKKRITRTALIPVFLLLAYGVYWLFKPFQGGMIYGICKTFLELNTRFPTTLHLIYNEEFSESIRLWYTQIDSFGEYKMEPIQCYFKQDEERGAILDKVTVNRREVDPQKVDEFNRVLSVVIQSKPDLTLPPGLPDALEGVEIDTDKYRKSIVDR